ncbi:MAG TPA: protein kinase, partial [Vicinamibacterales bacterium]
ILPEAVARDPDRTARFAREARTLAALNHPHIAQLHGFEEAGEIRALVMELVEGEDLSQIIARGPLPLDEALPIARQIAEALEAAHDAGIIHRDLKPANIKVRPDGTVKVLDFGLAKIAEPGGTAPDATGSPTITTPAMTAAGIILGTAAYMSPEQAKGKPADKRSDVWAFGCVLYEMLTGVRAFAGEDVSDTLAAILRATPDWAKLDHNPRVVRRLIEGCLERDRRLRIGDVSVVRYVLADTEGLQAQSHVASRGALQAVGSTVWLALGVLTAIALALVYLVWNGSDRTEVVQAAQRFNLAIPDGASYVGTDRGDIALSPDGTRLVYPVMQNNRRVLYLRTIGAFDDRPLVGTENGIGPFFSPDGEWLAFFQIENTQISGAGTLRKVPLSGGPPITVCPVVNPMGASWSDDGNIIYATGNTRGPTSETALFEVPAGGGSEPRRITVANTGSAGLLVYPEVLPGSRHLLVAARSSMTSPSQISVLAEGTGALHRLIDNAAHPRYVQSGHLLYVSDRSLMAVPFDATRLQVTGDPVVVAADVASNFRGDAGFAVSQRGTVVYASAEVDANTDRSLVFVDRIGGEQDVGAPARQYYYPRVSPDGARIALDVRDSGNRLGNPKGGAGTSFDGDIWIWEIARKVLTPFTRDKGDDQYPAWTPDGKYIAFSAFGGTRPGGIYVQSVEAAENAQLWMPMSSASAPYAFTPDGKRLIMRETRGSTTDDLMLLTPPQGSTMKGTLSPLLATQFAENNAALSPDGRWIALQSNESGAFEIHVRPFPDVDRGRTVVSTSGGTRPVWSRDGKELFYLSGQSPSLVGVMRVPVSAGANFSAGAPQRLFQGRYFVSPLPGGRGRSFDVMPDGKRFVMIKDVPAPTATTAAVPFVVVLNWIAELRQPASQHRQ